MDWIRIVGLVTFVGDAARGLLFPALWPLCSKLGIFFVDFFLLEHKNEFFNLSFTTGGSEIDLGYLVALFSLGRLIIAPVLGMISDTYRHRFTLLFSTVILCIGAAVWANAELLGGLSTLYLAQLLLGLGTG